MWPIKERNNRHLLIKWPNPITSCKMLRYGSLIDINPSVPAKADANFSFFFEILKLVLFDVLLKRNKGTYLVC